MKRATGLMALPGLMLLTGISAAAPQSFARVAGPSFGESLRDLRVSAVNFCLAGFTTQTKGPAEIHFQNNQANRLTPIHWPDLTSLEPEVRAQLLGVEKSLTDVIHNASLPDAGRAAAYGDAGRIYHAYSLIAPARECYLNANVLAPKDFRWLYLLAKIDQQEGRVEAAIGRFEQAGALAPEYAAIDVNLGNSYLELSRADKAAASFEKALRQQPANGAALYGLGQIALSQRRYSAAINYFAKALEQVPGANRIHYSLALAYRGLGDKAQAESHLAQRGSVGVRVSDRLMDELPDLIEGERVHVARGRTAVEAKRFADAAAEFRKAIASRPDSVTAHSNLATTLVQLNDLNAAVAEFKTVLRLDPANSNAHFNLAIVLDMQQKYDEVVDELRALLKVTPTDTKARFFLAKELLKAGRRAEAFTELVLVTQANPDDEEALLLTVDLSIQEKQYSSALALLERANAQYPQKADTAATLAYLLATAPGLDTRNGSRALQLAQKAYAVTGSVQHGAVIALAFGELNRCAEAAAWQRKMINQAEQQQQIELAGKLKKDLQLYEGKQMCRPAGQ